MKYLKSGEKLLTSNGFLLTMMESVPRVKWLWDENTPIYGIGDNLTKAYNCWCPHNLQYDKARNRFIFVQCHKNSHASNTYISATMHIVYPDDILKKTDITIPSIIGIANLVILDDGTYLLYPKTTDAVRYVSTDGGTTWTSQSLNTDLHHAFGIYYCNGSFYAGCDSVWGEYHYSEDGITWTTKNLDWTDENGCHTKEHSFCFWNGHVYAFGRRDFYKNDEASQGLVDDYNGCAVVFRLDGDEWTVVDDSHLLAFQSNCSPVAFEEGIAIAHINRTSTPALYYTVYNGQTFTTKYTFDNLGRSGSQQEFTTPSLAFGNGYACIACSMWVDLCPLGVTGCINTMFVGTYEGKTTKKYFEYEPGLLSVNVAKMFNENPDDFTFYPSGSKDNISWRWSTSNYDTIVNNNDYNVYFHFTSYPHLFMRLLLNSSWYPIYNGKFVDFSVLGGSKTNATTHNWLMDYDNRHFAIGGRGQDGDYTGIYASISHRFVIECNLVDASTQPTADLSSLPNGTIVRTISANGGYVEYDNKGTGRYLTFLET